MAEAAKRLATYADLEAVPANLVAEIIYGALVNHPRPFPRHGYAGNALAAKLTLWPSEPIAPPNSSED